MKQKPECPKCGNTMGFSFGGCISCGWNYVTNKWDWIRVNPKLLPDEWKDYFVRNHEKYYNKK